MSPPEEIIEKNGLDAYMFLRFIKMLIWIFLVFTISTFLIIIPADTVGITPTGDRLARLTWSNISDTPGSQNRFAAHIILAYLLTFFVFFILRREMLHFVHKRHQFLISKSHSKLPQARTVLITAVPEELANEHDIRQFCSFVPGGVDRVWIFRDTRALNDLFQARADACENLEAAQAKVLRHATMTWRTRQRQIAQRNKKAAKHNGDEDVELAHINGTEDVVASPALLNDLVPIASRPKHRMGFLGLIGTKVDSIEWHKEEISRLNTKIKEAREHVVKGKFLGSVFVRCNLQMGAHVLAQCVSFHEPLTMYDKWMEANPRDIVWRNLDDGALEMGFRYVVSWGATIALILLWAVPAAFIGSLSNIDKACADVSWLSWFCHNISDVSRGIIQGVLPPLLLAIVFAVLPFILRGLAWYECIPRYSLISVSVYRRFFLFLLIHGFLIVTITGGLLNAFEELVNNPTSTIQTLANELPGASTFFLTYIVTQGLSGAGLALIQLVPLLLHFIRKWFLGRTPRQAYAVTFLMPAADFGTVLPRLSLLATIGFAYSVITPMINLLALVGFSCFYFAWKFLLTQVFDQPDEAETGGLYFPMAVSNLFVGLYIEQICLACLFFLKASAFPRASIVQGIMMILLLVITVGAQITLHRSFNPITQYLPMSLATKKMAKRYAAERSKTGEKVGGGIDDDVIDLFSRERVRRLRRRIKAIPKQLDAKLDDIKAKVRPSEDGTTRGASIESSAVKEKMKDKEKRERKAEKEQIKEEEKQAEQEEKQKREAAEEKARNPERADSAGQASQPQPSEGAPELYRILSTSSKASKASTSSAKSKKKDEPPVFDAPAPAGIDLSDDEYDDEEEEHEEHAFDHPSTYREQPWIWIPKDTLGLSAIMVQELLTAGVESSDVGATMDERGVVEVTRNPPDLAWEGGHDR